MKALIVIHHIPLVCNMFVLFFGIKAVVPKAQFGTLFLPTHFICLLMYFLDWISIYFSIFVGPSPTGIRFHFISFTV